MMRYAVLLLLVTVLAWRYLPRVHVTWVAVAALFVLVVGVRAAQQAWS